MPDVRTADGRLDHRLFWRVFPLLLDAAGAQFPEFAVRYGRQQSTFSKYSLIPMQTGHVSYTRGGFWYVPPGEKITVTQGGFLSKGPVYIDAAQAVGLLYASSSHGKRLVAVAAAQVIEEPGAVFINQIQDVSGVPRPLPDAPQIDRMIREDTGLEGGGLAWRQSLVRAWERIAQSVGITQMVIQSHVNSRYPAVRQQGKGAYDEVARQLHYNSPDMPGGNWTRVLEAGQDTRR